MPDRESRVIHAVRTGPRGENPTILIHPVALDLTYWAGQIAALHRLHDVVAYDLPGNGDSEGTAEDWTFDAAAATVLRVLESTGAARANVVGISIGGMIAQAFALAHPERISSLVLIGTAATMPEQQRRLARDRGATARRDGMYAVIPSTLERWFTAATRISRPDITDRVTKTMSRCDPGIYAAMWDMMADLNFADQLGAIRVPTLVMTGDADPIFPPEVARRIHAAIPNSKLVIVPLAAHMCILEQPDFINERLAAFLSHRP